ncbi:MAG: tRNA lysidine(34) synthetase TilS [Bacillota bacterium]|nr:tRNA lysidine(34) synthetase TilS [Bacillota bacterium]
MQKKADEQIRETVIRHNLIEAGDHIVLGLSGGPDSMCLFHVLRKLAPDMDLTIHTVHVNHQFRPGAAERDQGYVEELTEKLGIDHHSFVVDCMGLAKKLGMTIEEAGRKARYDAFFKVASAVEDSLGKSRTGTDSEQKSGQVKIAVAQNAEDQAETILFRFLRGTGIDGLAGIAYERYEERDGRAFKVIRPLLDTRRESIEALCDSEGLNPVRDHTNDEALYARNKIRLELLPYLEENYNSNIRQALNRLGRIASSDKEFLWEEAQRQYDRMAIHDEAEETSQKEAGSADRNRVILDREALAKSHESIRHRIILKAFEEVGLASDVTAERIAAADKIIGKKQGPKTVEFPRGYKLTVAKGRVIFSR